MDQFNSSSSGGIIVDPNFERRLKELKEAINNLLEKAEKSNSTDRALQEQLQLLTERVDKINQIMTDMMNNTNVTEELISSALGNISEAEQSINRSRSMLDEAEKLLVDRGEKALNESILAANSTSEQATRMVEIRNEVTSSVCTVWTGTDVLTPCYSKGQPFPFVPCRMEWAWET